MQYFIIVNKLHLIYQFIIYFSVMYRIILVALLICSLHSQTVEVVDEPQTPPPLPSEPVANGYLLNPNRQMISSQLIEDVFSRQDLDCKFKIKFVECYLGKFKTMVFLSSMRKQKPEMSFDLEKAKNGQKEAERLHSSLVEVQQEIQELEELDEKIQAVENDSIEPEGRDRIRVLVRKYLLDILPEEL